MNNLGQNKMKVKNSIRNLNIYFNTVNPIFILYFPEFEGIHTQMPIKC